jgi:hypothetical protein
MKKQLKTISAIILALVVVTAISTISTLAQTSGTYSNTGSYSVATTSASGYTIYYPKNIATANTKFPVITWGNGTFASTFLYGSLLQHLASHGFIVIATDSTMNQSGSDMLAAVTYIIKQNSTSGSTFYNAVDVDEVGATGHSQGGGGAINCGSDSRIKCVAAIAPSPGDVTKMQYPLFLIAGSSDWIIIPALLVQPLYDASDVPTIYGTLVGVDHFAPVLNPSKYKGYLTAWFSAFLKNDSTAMAYFDGSNYGLKSDSEWTNVQRKNFD